MSERETRVEHDSMGELRVPADALYGAQTQRAAQNFQISTMRMPLRFLEALCLVKGCAARVNAQLGLLDAQRAEAIEDAAAELCIARSMQHFPVDVFQTGSGTSTNMNMNEVLATLASRSSRQPVSPNDHVNLGQSSNDVIPSCIHLSAAIAIDALLAPALEHLAVTIEARAGSLDNVLKTGRTHLMDAMPLSMGQELSGWAAQIRGASARVHSVLPRLHRLALGGTAVGTGVNAHPQFATRMASALSAATGLKLEPSGNFFESLGCQDTAVELSGQLRVIAVSLMKICNDLRWMNSGPLAGLAEVELPALQPGSSIMPGKVNPVIPEAVAMVAAQVMGNDAAIAVAGQSGSFQLNVMLPVIAHNLLQSIELLASASRHLADLAIRDLKTRPENLEGPLKRNPVLVTALNPIIGYLQAAKIAKTAYEQRRPVLDVALEMTDLDPDELGRLLDPANLVHGKKPSR